MPRLLPLAVGLILATALLLPTPGPVQAGPGVITDDPPAPAAAQLANGLAPGEVHGYRLRTSATGDFTVTAAPGPGLLLELRRGDSTTVVARRILSPAEGQDTWRIPGLAGGDYTLVLAPLGRSDPGTYRLTLAAPGVTLAPGVPRLGALSPDRRPWLPAAGTARWRLDARPPAPGTTAPVHAVLVVDREVRQTVTALPTTLTVDTTRMADGLHLLAVLARDANGNWAGWAGQLLVDNAASFSDVQPAHWARPEVEFLASLRLAGGYPDGSFQPERPVTRAEFVQFLVAAGGFPADEPPPPNFADVPADAWFYRPVAAARAAGLVVGEGRPEGSVFRPQDGVTRAEAAVMLTRAAGPAAAHERGRAALDFTDAARIPDWAAGAVAVAREQGLLTGYPDGRFAPAAAVTRAEAAAMVARLIR